MTAAELTELRFLIHVAIAVDQTKNHRCFQKQKHPTEAIAKRSARNFDGKVMAYHCTACHAWHVGGQYAVKRKSDQSQKGHEIAENGL